MNIDPQGLPQPEKSNLGKALGNMKNLSYTTDAISAYFASNRRAWEQFYPSERWIIDRVAADRAGQLGDVLDVGCACGGLGAALGGRFGVSRYVGVDINSQAIALAKAASDIAVPHEFLEGDITRNGTLKQAAFDTVFNLSCADWNVDFSGILKSSWSFVAPGGILIISLRLTDGLGARAMDRSYQFIHYGEPADLPADAEKAAYVVLNVSEALAELGRLGPDRVQGYGYWGAPSATARTPFDRLAFSVFALRKPIGGASTTPADFDLNFPGDIWRWPLS
jgi:SAM-dependent methyltransferase